MRLCTSDCTVHVNAHKVNMRFDSKHNSSSALIELLYNCNSRVHFPSMLGKLSYCI